MAAEKSMLAERFAVSDKRLAAGESYRRYTNFFAYRSSLTAYRLSKESTNRHPSARIRYHSPMGGQSIHRVHKVLKHLKGRVSPQLETLRKRIRASSEGPGIYRWLDKNGKVMYVGKAKNLKKRLAWYVNPRPGAFVGPWRQSFLEQIHDFDVTVTNTELEALILETNLIKELRPKYNVLMKDDKNYLYYRITLQDTYPRVDTVRKVVNDGSKYFGPTLSGYEVHRTLQLLRRLYPFRTCKMGIEVAHPLPLGDSEAVSDKRLGASNNEEANRVPLIANHSSTIPLDVICTHKDRMTPCLDYHIEQCSAPCIGLKSPEEYFKESIEGVLTFLKGDREPARKLLLERMAIAAKEKKFEQAAKFRDLLGSMDAMQEKQVISDPSGENSDIVGVAVLSGRAHTIVLQCRNGKLIGESHFELAGQAEDIAEVLEQFLPQFYDDGIDLPDALVIPVDFPGRKTLSQWLEVKRGKKVKVTIPERGKKSQLLQLAEKNAMEKARQLEVRWESEKANTQAALEGLQKHLELPSLPHRIEGYDISHLGGTETVGSMVVMCDGKAANDHYRSFIIRSVAAGDIDDYRSLQEVLRRRLRYIQENVSAEEKKWKEEGVSFGKIRKKEHEVITEIMKKYPEELWERPIADCDFFVARMREEVIGFTYKHTYSEKMQEICGVWAAEAYKGTRLSLFLLRKILRTIKKGKAYIVVKAIHESAYSEAGFRYVIQPPPQLQERLETILKEKPEEEYIAMMFEAFQNKMDPSLSSRPDLLVIDGGKGQLSSVVDVLKEYDLKIPVIGLAKREEEVFVPIKKTPVVFPKDSQSKFLLMRLRDEAHRFANRLREVKGKKKAVHSILDEVPGIGEETKKKLMNAFGTISSIKAASDAELLEILSETQLEAMRKVL
jgi:excinuclease ABC subunit C